MGPGALLPSYKPLASTGNKKCRNGSESPDGRRNSGYGGLFVSAPGAYERHLGYAGYHEETFGPVAAVIKVMDETDAVEIANDNPYDLGAAIFTNDIEKS